MSPSELPVEAALGRASGGRRAEADELLALFGDVTRQQPTVWAGRIIGYGEYEYRYDSGRTGRAPELAFATGAREHTLYLVNDASTRWPDVFDRLGKHRASRACVYLTRLTGVDRGALRELLELSLAETRRTQAP
ncbi:DUF1801 domain-containing protein [Microbacterium sp. G2-8]|uniref:DUF1801 domain-containing protein n=1 Tax=Microbacterium sp. G2-8 TaxID=2842454 RepID=UPI0021AA94E1|nr:DUF1801 domain-containing protein [Microbacterium sp. G2-8]